MPLDLHEPASNASTMQGTHQLSKPVRHHYPLRTDRNEVTGGDRALDVEPVFDLVELAIVAVERCGHLATGGVCEYLALLSLRHTHVSSALDGRLQLI